MKDLDTATACVCVTSPQVTATQYARRRRIGPGALVVLMFFSIALACRSSVAEFQAGNVCTNGSFEILGPNGFPVHWAPVGREVSVSRDAFDGQFSLRLVRTRQTATPETGLNRAHRPGDPRPGLIDRIKGGMQFAYKAISAEDAELRISVIPVNEQLVEKTGAPRTTYVVPAEHIGDGRWHLARIAYDYTDNPQVRYVHFAVRIVGTAGEILVDNFTYLESAGPVISLGDPLLEEDTTRPGEAGVLRVVVNNLGDRPADICELSLVLPPGLEADPPVQRLTNLQIKQPTAVRWNILGTRRTEGWITIRATGAEPVVDRRLRLEPRLRLRSFGAREPVYFAGDNIALECELENTGQVILGPLSLRFRAGVDEKHARVNALPPSQKMVIRAEFPAPTTPQARVPVSVEIAGQGLAAEKLESGVRLLPQVSLPKPSDGLNATAGASWAVLENGRLRLVFAREKEGFSAGWLELKTAAGSWRRAAWIPSLGRLAIKATGSPEGEAVHEVRLIARSTPRAETAAGYASLVFADRIDTGPAATVEFAIRFQLPAEENLLGWSVEATAQRRLDLAALDAPMLYVVDRSEAIFPGLEWLVDDELSSDWLDIAKDHPARIRYVPHPQKITIPAVSFCGTFGTLGYLWDVHQKWDGLRDRPACVFASPDQWNHQRSHLVGLMLPAVPEFVPENGRLAEKPYPWGPGTTLRLSGWIVADGSRSDPLYPIETYLALVGLPPKRPLPRGSYPAEVAFSMQAYLRSLWDEKEQKWWTSKGGGILSRLERPPHYAADLLLPELVLDDSALQSVCRARAELVASLINLPPRWDALRFPGRFDISLAGPSGPAGLLAQRDDSGAWRFDADQRGTGPFESMDYRKLGPHGAVEVGTCAHRAYLVLRYARVAGDWDTYHMMLPTLELMEKFRVPRAAQVWEIPVHTPDVLAAADAVDAYLEAYRFSGEERWLHNAILWAKRGLPFIYLWDDPDKPFLQGASIPVFGATWYHGAWFGRPVQWNGLRYARALLRLAEYDTTLPWREIAERIVISALYQQDPEGENVALWPDAICAITGEKVPWLFAPRQILDLVLQMLGRDPEPETVAVGRPPQEIRITSLARISDVEWSGGRLAFRVCFRPREQGCVLVSNLGRPTDVLVDGQPVPEDPQAERGNEFAWRYDAAFAYLVVRIPTERPVDVEVVPAEYSHRERIARLVEEIAFEFDRSLEGWLPAHHVDQVTVSDGMLVGTVTGADPYIVRPSLRIPPDRHRILRLRMRTTAGPIAQVFWTTADSPQYDEAKSIRFRVDTSGELAEYTLDVGSHPLWQGKTITGLRLDPGGGIVPAEFAVDWIRGE